MTIKKRYFIWKCYTENPRFISHPNTFLDKKEAWADKIKVQEYGYNDGNGWYLGHIEWDDTKVTAQQILDHAEDFNKYTFQVRTPEQVITLLNTIYGDYFSLDSDGWTIIDERPLEEFI